ncbi:hypothetical protein ACN42_g6823 [Penicillium freii]|uniref:Uncharacterized protein n=1 Tax=Penicillium freii TaxID=48697 RepID=A0A101MGT0_PENFR|nr:hypothetical protein ACN42_g6823 [Penicillium freii]
MRHMGVRRWLRCYRSIRPCLVLIRILIQEHRGTYPSTTLRYGVCDVQIWIARQSSLSVLNEKRKSQHAPIQLCLVGWWSVKNFSAEMRSAEFIPRALGNSRVDKSQVLQQAFNLIRDQICAKIENVARASPKEAGEVERQHQGSANQISSYA